MSLSSYVKKWLQTVGDPTVKQEIQEIQKKENDMFDKIFSAIKKEQGTAHLSSIMNALNHLVVHFSDEFVKSPTDKDEALDGLCEYLNGLKQPKQAY